MTARGRVLSRVLTALAVAAAALVGVSAAPAAADPGSCTPTVGVVVAVDFHPFGGGIERGCDPTPTTGLEALHTAGFSTVGTQHDGPAFVCRIKGLPTATADPCVVTPPSTRYWSYWHADAGQAGWSYGQLGAASYRPKAGSVDAWVYGATDTGGGGGGPSFSPSSVRATAPVAAPAPSSSTGPAGGSGGGSGGGGGGGGGATAVRRGRRLGRLGRLGWLGWLGRLEWLGPRRRGEPQVRHQGADSDRLIRRTGGSRRVCGAGSGDDVDQLRPRRRRPRPPRRHRPRPATQPPRPPTHR